MQPHIIPLIQSKLDTKSKIFFNIKLCRNPTLEASDMYELKAGLFDSGELEEFILFQHDYKMTLEALGTPTAGAKVQYLCTLMFI